MFFGTPHKGILTDDILSMIDPENYQERAELVNSLNPESKDLKLQLERFINLPAEFKIYSFYELKKSRRLVKIGANWSRSGDSSLPVAKESAILNLPSGRETIIGVEQDHSAMVKFTAKQDNAYRSTLRFLRELRDTFIQDLLRDTPVKYASSISEALLTAILGGNVHCVKNLLKKGVNVSAEYLGNTPLVLAV